MASRSWLLWIALALVGLQCAQSCEPSPVTFEDVEYPQSQCATLSFPRDLVCSAGTHVFFAVQVKSPITPRFTIYRDGSTGSIGDNIFSSYLATTASSPGGTCYGDVGADVAVNFTKSDCDGPGKPDFACIDMGWTQMSSSMLPQCPFAGSSGCSADGNFVPSRTDTVYYVSDGRQDSAVHPLVHRRVFLTG
eukprot:1434627-Rhodomonas_salina.1